MHSKPGRQSKLQNSCYQLRNHITYATLYYINIGLMQLNRHITVYGLNISQKVAIPILRPIRVSKQVPLLIGFFQPRATNCKACCYTFPLRPAISCRRVQIYIYIYIYPLIQLCAYVCMCATLQQIHKLIPLYTYCPKKKLLLQLAVYSF